MLRFNLNLFSIAALIMLMAASISKAETTYEAVPDEAQIERETIKAAENALDEMDALATSLSFAFDYLTAFLSESGPPDFLVHAELQATAQRLNGVRSILIVSKNGSIRHDAFSFPPPDVNLSERPYFRKALETPGLTFGEEVIGRTSGVPFTPISVYKPVLKSVVSAIINPGVLSEKLDWCADQSAPCGGTIADTNGEIIATSPRRGPIHSEITNLIIERPEQAGTLIFERPNFRTLVAFRKSERFPILVWTSHRITSDSALVVQ